MEKHEFHMKDNKDKTYYAEASMDQHQELLEWDGNGSLERISVVSPTVSIKFRSLYSYFVETLDDR